MIAFSRVWGFDDETGLTPDAAPPPELRAGRLAARVAARHLRAVFMPSRHIKYLSQASYQLAGQLAGMGSGLPLDRELSDFVSGLQGGITPENRARVVRDAQAVRARLAAVEYLAKSIRETAGEVIDVAKGVRE